MLDGCRTRGWGPKGELEIHDGMLSRHYINCPTTGVATTVGSDLLVEASSFLSVIQFMVVRDIMMHRMTRRFATAIGDSDSH